MWKFAVLLMCLSGYCLAGPVGLKRNMPIVQQRDDTAAMETVADPIANVDPNEMMIMSSLTLPSNATSIRADITDGFSCENKTYGYYADVDNDCQIFHVCLPVTYANGQENTFRWSFICPEETIFSQESFTCMRPDDMTITCEESYQYYELNRNFGMIENAADKETNNEVTSETAESNEIILEADNQPQTKPVVQEEDEKYVVKPVGQAKPVKAQKPLRRKPSISFATQKKPTTTYPLRKMPQVPVQPAVDKTPDVQMPEDNQKENIKPVEEEEIKPVAQKFSRRPVPDMSNSFKDKIQNSKPENVMATRTELFNQNIKRPTMFNKMPVQAQDEAKEEEVKIETEVEQQNFSPMAVEVSNSNTETQVADSEIQASETDHVFVKPEEVSESIDAQNVAEPEKIEEPVQVLEAFEEIPAVISEVVETPNADKEKETKNEVIMPVVTVEEDENAKKSETAEDQQNAEKVPNAEEVQTVAEEVKTSEEVQTVDEVQPVAEETQTAEQTQTADETENSEETSDVHQSLRTSAEEGQQVAEEVPVVEETQTAEEEPQAAEEEPQVGQEEIQLAEEEHHVVEESQAAGNTQTAEETQATEESEAVVEEIQTAEEPEAVVEETQAAKIPEAMQESQTAEEELKTSVEENQNSEETQTAEEISVVEEVHTADELTAPEELPTVDEQHVSELAQSAEEIQVAEKVPVSEEIQTVKKTQTAEEPQSAEETQENELSSIVEIHEAPEQTPAEETLAVEEPQPIEVVEPVEDVQSAEESEIEAKPAKEDDMETESVVEPVAEESEAVKSENVAEPAIFEENSEEGTNVAPVQTIEEMESEKPAEAPESMQATEEMSHPDAMVQQIYEDMEVNKQSIGGFKPVDPVMAHEAEQLIADFINTLRKNDFTNETPGMHLIAEPEQSQENQENIAEVQEVEKIESNEVNQEETEKVEKEEKNHEAEEVKEETEPEIIEVQADSVENNAEEMQEANEVEEPKQENEMGAEENNEFNALQSLETQSVENMEESQKSEIAQEVYQIPVQVITTPLEQVPIEQEQSQEIEVEPAVEMTANTEEKVEEETPAMVMGGYKPLSIDDIVELVKERLDHMPKNEMETPMQLEQVLGEAQEDKTPGEKVNEQSASQDDEPQQTSQSEEEIVMPIYQRMVQPVKVDAGVQTDDLEQVVGGEQTDDTDTVADAKEKTNRSLRSRSLLIKKLDPRKRRFLFKADLS